MTIFLLKDGCEISGIGMFQGRKGLLQQVGGRVAAFITSNKVFKVCCERNSFF